jgi:3-dehydroquinate synthase
VAVGMVCAAKISHLLGLCNYDVVKEIKEILDIYNLPSDISSLDIAVDNKILAEYCAGDKKTEGADIQFVLLTDIGKCTVKKIAANGLYDILCNI